MGERIIEPSEFEKRANSFLGKVIVLQEQDEGLRWHAVSYDARKTFPGLIGGLDKLQSLISDEGETDFASPGELADEYDIESASSCIVEVKTVTDARRPLEAFVSKVLKLGKKHEGEVDTSMNFGTEKEVDFIYSWEDEANGWLYRAMIYFRFS